MSFNGPTFGAAAGFTKATAEGGGAIKGDKGDPGPQGPKGDKGDKGDPGVGADINLEEIKDVNVSDTQNNDILVYDEETKTWVNKSMPFIPTKTSDLTNDAKFVTEDDIPDVPTKVSELENDSKFVTEDDLSGYINLDTGADLNTLVDYGTYRTTTKRIDRIDNVPVQVAGMLEVRLTGSIIYHTYKTIGNDVFIRSSEDGGTNWSEWKKIATDTSNIEKSIADNWNGNGYNLIPFPYYDGMSKTSHEVTFTVNNDGSVTAEGTATSTTIFYLTNASLLIKKGTYYISGCPTGGSATGFSLDITEGQGGAILTRDIGDGIIYTFAEDKTEAQIRVRIGGGVSVDNITYKPMLVKVNEDGSYPTEYQRYASGNVELTQTLDITQKSVSDNWNENGYNLIKFPYYHYDSYTNNGVTYNYGDDGIITLSGTATETSAFGIETRTETSRLYLKGINNITGGINQKIRLRVSCTINGSLNTIGYDEGNGFMFNADDFVTDSGAFGMHIVVSSGVNCDGITIKPMITKVAEDGSYPTKYQRYASGNAKLTDEIARKELELAELKMLGWNVPKDCPIKNEVNGNQFVQKVGRVDLGSLTWKYDSASDKVWFYATLSGANIPTVTSEPIKAYTKNYTTMSRDDLKKDTTAKGLCGAGTYVIIRDIGYTNADTFKASVQGQYLYYELATPITTQIDGNEQISEINAKLDKLMYYSTGDVWGNDSSVDLILAGTISTDGTKVTFSVQFDKEIRANKSTISASANYMYLRQEGKSQLIVNNPVITALNVGKHSIQFVINVSGYASLSTCILVLDQLTINF